MSADPLDEDALDFLEPDSRRLILEMLKAVVEHPDIYNNGFSVRRQRDNTYEYFLASRGIPGPFSNLQRLPINVTDALLHYRIAGPRINAQWPKEFHSFTEAALDWQRTYGGISQETIRKGIGRILRQQIRTSKISKFDIDEVATKLGVSPQLVREQIEILSAIGLIESNDDAPSVLRLSKPAGILWAEQGYPSIQSLGSHAINVTVDLHIEIHAIIEQARATGLPDETVKEFEVLLHRAEEELEKPAGQGRFQRLSELMAFASNVKELAPLAARLIYEHGDKIQTLIS